MKPTGTKDPGARTKGNLIRCRRLEAWRTPAEHLACPYCFGDGAAVRRGRWEAFCDFEPGVDPICFGFPATHGRLARG